MPDDAPPSLQEPAPSSAVSNGSGELADSLRGDIEDSCDGRQGHDKVRGASEHLQNKMHRTRDLIKQEQKARDGGC